MKVSTELKVQKKQINKKGPKRICSGWSGKANYTLDCHPLVSKTVVRDQNM